MKISKKEATLIGILILVIAGAIAYVTWNTFNPKLEAAKAELASVEAEKDRIDSTISKYGSYKQKIGKEQKKTIKLTDYLYDEQSNDETDFAIQTIATQYGLTLKSFNILSVEANYKNLTLECTGSFDQMNQFIQRINNYEHSLGIQDIIINQNNLRLNLIAYHENKDVLREDFSKE